MSGLAWIWLISFALVHAQVEAPLLASEDAAREAFKRGVEAFQQKQFELSEAQLTKVPELGGYLSLYKHWYLGQVLLELGKFKEAEPEFIKVMQSNVSNELKYQARFFLGETALRQKNYKESVNHLKPLERKWRRSYRLPEVLYRIMAADLKLGNISSACNRAHKLYANHPAHALVIHWGADLNQVKIDGKELPCTLTNAHFSKRVRSLQWAGESDKAHKEITQKLAKLPEDQRLSLDLTLAGYLVNEGSVDDALNLLIRYYPQQKSSVGYLNLLAKAAARSGEYQTAVGAYERVYTLNPRSRNGRAALYQAAYLSYQFQDYDGAVRKFQQFKKANPRSGLSKDAEWHLAWLQYLRNDYKGAIKQFQAVIKKLKRRRRRSDSLQERALYWVAMSHIRLSEFEKASDVFESIIIKNPYSYYGLAAQARLESIRKKIEGSKPPRALASLKTMPSEIPAGSENLAAGEEKESEEDISETIEAAGEVSVEGEESVVVGQEEAVEDEIIQASSFKDPKMRARIDVAQKLIELGQHDLARFELWEVERRTRNPQYLRLLITAYEGIHSYHRSAHIAELSFGRERERQGLEGGRIYWQQMYPQAFKSLVDKATRDFSTPNEWVWAIMRAESMYKSDVVSPVGAQGLMQLMPFTASNLNRLAGEGVVEREELLNPELNIRLGTQYLARLRQKFKGQLPLAAAAYNAGPHRVENWLMNFGHLEADEFVEHIPFLETRNYVKKVVRHHTFYRRLYAKDQRPIDYLAKPLGVPIPSRAATRENWDSL